MTITTLFYGQGVQAREYAIAEVLEANSISPVFTALILEGTSDGPSPLDRPTHPALICQERIAPGCVCCTGNLVLRVTLNRILRKAPTRLYISVAIASHIEQLRAFLTQAPYSDYLTLTPDVHLQDI